ncbi:MAG TPA: site-specific integrase [Candidatus Eisenbacteria bacterium]|nr:site-specific integrase [Candidatus Eisenbacteria bacterium]
MDESTDRRTRRRANGEGSIYETAGGRLRGAIAWTDAHGDRQRRVVSGRTRAEVRRALAAIRSDLDRGIAPAPTGTVATFLAEWLAASRQRIRASTWRQYDLSTRLYLVPALGRLALAKMTPADVERMTAAVIAGGRAPRTAALARTVLRRALGDALRDGRVHRNVAALARPPHVPSRSLEAGRDYLNTVQLRRLLTAAKVHPLGPLVTVAAATGLRQGELLGLAWPDVDDEAGTLTVRRSLAVAWQGRGAEATLGWSLAEPKTPRSRRTINLPAAARAALDRQRDLQEAAQELAGSAWQDRDGLIFTDAVGRPLHGHQVTHAFHRLLEAAGLPSIPFHGLRHSAATALLAGGVPMKVVSEMLGHSTITVTADRYAGVVPAQRREAAEAMDRALG